MEMSCRAGNDCRSSCGGAAAASPRRNDPTLPPQSGHPRHCCSGQAAFPVRCLLSCSNSCCESGSCWSPVESLRSAWLRCSSPPRWHWLPGLPRRGSSRQRRTDSETPREPVRPGGPAGHATLIVRIVVVESASSVVHTSLIVRIVVLESCGAAVHASLVHRVVVM